MFRYGLVVLVIVAFLVALLAPYAVARPAYDAAINAGAVGLAEPGIADFLGTAVIAAIIVAVIAVIVYFIYQNVLQRTVQP